MKLDYAFFDRDCLDVAPDLVGKVIVRQLDDGTQTRVRITETEAYRGIEDKACHASKGVTPRTKILFDKPATIYVYICYGMHFLMNVVTEKEGTPQAVLFRCGEKFNGPAKLTKAINVDKSFNGESFIDNARIWIEDDGYKPEITTAPRVGIDYAGDEWKNKPWRFIDKNIK